MRYLFKRWATFYEQSRVTPILVLFCPCSLGPSICCKTIALLCFYILAWIQCWCRKTLACWLIQLCYDFSGTRLPTVEHHCSNVAVTMKKIISIMATSVNRAALRNHPYFFLYWPCSVVYWALKYLSPFLAPLLFNVKRPGNSTSNSYHSTPAMWSEADAQKGIKVLLIRVEYFDKHVYKHVSQAMACFICPSAWVFNFAGQIVRIKELHLCPDSSHVEVMALCVLPCRDWGIGLERNK